MADRIDPPPWTVTLVCGASGVGKSSVAIPLAARYGTPLAEADDIVTALTALTTSEHAPTLHYWRTHPEAGSWTPQKIVELHLAVADALRAGFHAVIADHIEYGTPVIFEGDYLTPDLANGFAGAVRAVVIDEADEDRVVTNYSTREPATGVQRHRAKVTSLLSAQLRERAAAAGMPVVPAWPWATGVDRVDSALRQWRS